MNTFGTDTLRFGLVSGACVRDERARFRRPCLPLLERVNNLYVPGGRWPARGWFLLPRYEYAQLVLGAGTYAYGTDFSLEVGDATRPDSVGPIRGLAVVQAQCVTTGLASDPNALYLVEVTDARGVASSPWFQCPLTGGYNVRVPAYPDTFYPATMQEYAPGDGYTTWTWGGMLGDIWDRADAAVGGGAVLGAWSGMPSTSDPDVPYSFPSGTPEGFWFEGVPAWGALCDTLAYLGLTVAADLTQSPGEQYTIASIGANDPEYAATTAAMSPYLEDDEEWIDAGAGRAPGTVTVLFRRRNAVYGTEEAVRYDSTQVPQDAGPYQWATGAVYAVPIGAPTMFAGAPGAHFIWSDFTVRYDEDGALLDDDVDTADAIAQERVDQYYARIRAQTVGYVGRTYAGARPFVTGAQVDGVRYYLEDGDRRGGWRTQVVRGPDPPWSGLWDGMMR